MTFGKKLRIYRVKKGYTQTELARLAGLGLNTISNYEKGHTYPQNREVYAKLAELLDIDADFLHNENDEFTEAAFEKYGRRGRRQAEDLVAGVRGLFAGGDLSESEKDEVMQALQEAYWECKKENTEKYSSKKNS